MSCSPYVFQRGKRPSSDTQMHAASSQVVTARTSKYTNHPGGRIGSPARLRPKVAFLPCRWCCTLSRRPASSSGQAQSEAIVFMFIFRDKGGTGTSTPSENVLCISIDYKQYSNTRCQVGVLKDPWACTPYVTIYIYILSSPLDVEHL